MAKKSDPYAQLSKRMAYILRHKPDEFGVKLDQGGWIEIDELLNAMTDNGHPTTRADIDVMMSAASKRRYEIADTRIRAAQGHSIGVDLGLEPVEPPAVLFHLSLIHI